MKLIVVIIILVTWVFVYGCTDYSQINLNNNHLATVADHPSEGKVYLFLGQPKFDLQQIFIDRHFPNVVVMTEGTVLAMRGRNQYLVRCSEGDGKTWRLKIVVANPDFQGGSVMVGEASCNIFVFVEESHPLAPLTVYGNSDDSKTWQMQDIVIHLNESSITL